MCIFFEEQCLHFIGGFCPAVRYNPFGEVLVRTMHPVSKRDFHFHQVYSLGTVNKRLVLITEKCEVSDDCAFYLASVPSVFPWQKKRLAGRYSQLIILPWVITLSGVEEPLQHPCPYDRRITLQFRCLLCFRGKTTTNKKVVAKCHDL